MVIKSVSTMTFLALRSCLLLLLVAASGWAAAAPLLLVEDCQKCHTTVLQEIAATGGKHRDALTCIDCHKEHPPRGVNPIPACAQCHDPQQRGHFSVADCLGCHRPHSPLNIAYQQVSRVAPACRSCHSGQAAELMQYPSNHSILDCKACHAQHGEYFSCLDCHDPHLASQSYADCRRCHKPHSPLRVVYQNDIASEQCASCHVVQGKLLQQTTTKHRLLLCVYCHKSQHKRVPKCERCHFEPHDSGMHKKFPDCVICHGGPHNLVN